MRDFGRPSPAAAIEPPLRSPAGATSAGYRADGGATGWCVLRAATVTGVGHRLAGEGNQDYYAWADAGARLALAVADGLGSVPGSDCAAHLAAGAAVAAACDAYGTPLDAALAGVACAEAGLRGVEAAQGATTLIVGVAEPGREIALARVGDSTAFIVTPGAQQESESWREVFPPPSGDEDLVTVATGALTATMDSPPASIESVEVELLDGEVLVVVSDGVAVPWRDGPSTVAPAMAEGILARPSPLQLAGLADFSRQGCHDDRTILALWLARDGSPPADE
ncbi:MAG TPA: protein phosphatase 2C domain-containing protein [Acidimicrobiales bacterium]|nr:protein phosphatase 2C domain-containing protein [Acidimicrobiales bacterium]